MATPRLRGKLGGPVLAWKGATPSHVVTVNLVDAQHRHPFQFAFRVAPSDCLGFLVGSIFVLAGFAKGLVFRHSVPGCQAGYRIGFDSPTNSIMPHSQPTLNRSE